MGCCFSRSSGPNSPYPGGAPNASSRAINPPPLSLPEPAHGDHPRGASRRRRREQRPLDQHIDKPLRRHEWTSRDRPWTKRDIATERADFFDTRVTGRPEVWQTIHAALQVLWETVDQDAQDFNSSGLATAQMILSAAEISLPTGNLVNGVYDALGNYYQLPEWVVSDPQNLIQEPDASAKTDISTAGDDTTAEDDMTDDDDEIEGRKREKGKEVIDVREMVSLRARLSENGQDIKLSISESETVKSVARKIAQHAELASTKRIRIAYMGKMLKENSSLAAQGWQTGHVVNALVFNR